MSITINGDGTITGISAGGLPDAIITQPELASGVAGNGPAFSAFQGTTQTIALSTLTKVSFNTERFDTSACFDTTLFRFTPNIAGYYQINVNVMFDYSISQFSSTTLVLQKNGTTIHTVSTNTVNWYGNRLLNEVVYMNGTTDYLEVYGSIVGGAGPQFLGGTIYNSFSGAMVRAA
jgi:hypothetical protein